MRERFKADPLRSMGGPGSRAVFPASGDRLICPPNLMESLKASCKLLGIREQVINCALKRWQVALHDLEHAVDVDPEVLVSD